MLTAGELKMVLEASAYLGLMNSGTVPLDSPRQERY